MLLEYDKGLFLCVRDPLKPVKRARLGFLATQGLYRKLEERFLAIFIEKEELFGCSGQSVRELYWEKTRELLRKRGKHVIN